MASPEYAKGTRAERELMAQAQRAGADVYRGAGSHGAYDVAVTKWGLRFLVNIKCNTWAGPLERYRLAALTSSSDIPVLARKRDRKGWDYRTVSESGEMGLISVNAPWLRDDVGRMNGSR